MIAYEDDASRKIFSIGEFTHATTENALSVSKLAEDIARESRVKITAVNTDRGTQFYASGGEKKKKGVSLFKQYLDARGVKHIPSPRSGIIHKRTVRSSGGFRSTEDLGGGLILLMRFPSGIITVYMGHSIWNTLKL
ncbi:hypothetical protein C5S53_16020 [Methanophagales archaeon]|nr:hypothetical protein C5S53_16020 [Methanophagales archaeon]